MNIAIINDCKDANVEGRQLTRLASLVDGHISFIGVDNDIEAAGNLVDILDAFGESDGCILVNVAPRNGKAKKWENGTPFGYFWYKKVLVVASIDGFTLSLVKKLNLVDFVYVLDIPTVLDILVAKKILPLDTKDYIIKTQFRSYDFLPRVASFLLKYKEVESVKYSIKEITDLSPVIWWIDNFGNCKTTVLLDDTLKSNNQIVTKFGALPYFSQLKDVPNNSLAIVAGSSGIGDKRFLEIVIQGQSASLKLDTSVSDLVL